MPDAKQVKRASRALGIGILDGKCRPRLVGNSDATQFGTSAAIAEQEPRLADRFNPDLRCRSAQPGNKWPGEIPDSSGNGATSSSRANWRIVSRDSGNIG